MFSYLLGIMAITIYNQSYGSSSVLKIMNRYDKVMTSAMKLREFSSMVLVIKSLAIGITMVLYFIDLSSKVTEKNFSIEQFFKATLRCVTSYMFIMNADVIVGYLLQIGSDTANGISDKTGLDFFDSKNKSMLINGIAKMKLMDILSYILTCIIPWIISMIGEIILQVVLISRILEIVTMSVFAPLAIADIYREGTSSSGIQYMKRVLALGLQVAVIIIINATTQAIIVQVIGANTSDNITGLLQTSGQIFSNKDIFSKDSIKDFLDAITANVRMMKALGVSLARLGLIWNSMPLCEEITGAR